MVKIFYASRDFLQYKSYLNFSDYRQFHNYNLSYMADYIFYFDNDKIRYLKNRNGLFTHKHTIDSEYKHMIEISAKEIK